jgi:hypothetical protein
MGQTFINTFSAPTISYNCSPLVLSKLPVWLFVFTSTAHLSWRVEPHQFSLPGHRCPFWFKKMTLSSRAPPEIAPGSFLHLQSKPHERKRTSIKCHGIIRPPHPWGISPHNTYMFTFVDIPSINSFWKCMPVGGRWILWSVQQSTLDLIFGRPMLEEPRTNNFEWRQRMTWKDLCICVLFIWT